MKKNVKIYAGYSRVIGKIFVYDNNMLIGDYDLSTKCISYASDYERYYDDIYNAITSVLYNMN